MNDRELLELAARAAGYDVARHSDDGASLLLFGVQEPWNPLTDDGDALRLAVKVGILIAPPAYNGGWQATASAKADETAWIDDTSGSHEESTRRAIVRASAEIGKAMQ